MTEPPSSHTTGHMVAINRDGQKPRRLMVETNVELKKSAPVQGPGCSVASASALRQKPEPHLMRKDTGLLRTYSYKFIESSV